MVYKFFNTFKISSLNYHKFYKIEICRFCKKVCSSERGLSLQMYHSFECFQKLTDISKKYYNYSLIHTQANKSPCIHQNLPKEQYMQLIKIKKPKYHMIMILI